LKKIYQLLTGNTRVLYNLDRINLEGFGFGVSFMEMIPLESIDTAAAAADAAHHIAEMLIHLATTTRTILYDCNQGNFLKRNITVTQEHSVNRYTIIDLGRVCSLETTNGVRLLIASFVHLMIHVERQTPNYPTFEAICNFFGVEEPGAADAKLQVKARFVKELEFRNFDPADNHQEKKSKAHRILMILAFTDLMINKHVFGGRDYFQMEFIIRNIYSGEYRGKLITSSLSGFLSIFSLDKITDKENWLHSIIPDDDTLNYKIFIPNVENYSLLNWLRSYVSTKKRTIEKQQPMTEEQHMQATHALKTFLDEERERTMRQRREELKSANSIYSGWCKDIKKIHILSRPPPPPPSPPQTIKRDRQSMPIKPPPPPPPCKNGSGSGCVMMGGTKKKSRRLRRRKSKSKIQRRGKSVKRRRQ
jgi:hypothetical protein